jgi:hypothetical protein
MLFGYGHKALLKLYLSVQYFRWYLRKMICQDTLSTSYPDEARTDKLAVFINTDELRKSEMIYANKFY